MPQFETSRAIQKLQRLRSMQPRELAHRLREKGYSHLERIGSRARIPSAPEGVSFKNYLAGAPARRFYPGSHEPIRQFVEARFPEWIERAVQEGQRLRRRHLELLNFGPIELDREINWHRDPIASRVWERRFWADYRPEHDNGGRDPKTIHELNRHQHLPRLAKAYLLTGDERYAAEAVAQLNSWIEQNPEGYGINWQSSLEIGIRSISWLWTIFLLRDSKSLDEVSAERIGASLFAQIEHVYRHLSVFSSPNTHLIGEATALFIAGTVFRDQKRPAAWLERGGALLAEQANIQILDDGVYGELSSYYHCYALDFYLQALILADQNKLPIQERMRGKVRGMLNFLMHLTRPDGTLPLLGDDDGGRALALDKRNYRGFNDALCIGAVLFGREDFKHQSGAFAEEALWFLGPHAWETYDGLRSEPPAKTQAFYPSGGYAIQRSGWGALASHLVFDCGGLGMLTGGHSHADALSIVLFSEGREILCDPGTFVYNCAPEWRGYFRSTRAHNTVTIDGADQAEPGGTFLWKKKFSTRVVKESTIEYVEAEHDGYGRLAQGVIHRRRLLRVPSYWIVVDDFSGAGKHTFDFNYHFGPDINVSVEQTQPSDLAVRTEAGLLLELCASGPLDIQLSNGQTAPIGGWVSHGYGAKTSSTTLCARLTGPAPAAITFLAPMQGKIRQLAVEDGSAIACAYKNDGYEDIVVFSTGDSEIAVADFRMLGEFFWFRMEGSTLLAVIAIRALSLHHQGRSVFQKTEPGTYCSQSGLKDENLCAQSAGS